MLLIMLLLNLYSSPLLFIFYPIENPLFIISDFNLYALIYSPVLRRRCYGVLVTHVCLPFWKSLAIWVASQWGVTISEMILKNAYGSNTFVGWGLCVLQKFLYPSVWKASLHLLFHVLLFCMVSSIRMERIVCPFCL